MMHPDDIAALMKLAMFATALVVIIFAYRCGIIAYKMLESFQ
jgi:hypothetical protein